MLLESLLASGDSVACQLEADSLEQTLRTEEQEPEPATRSLIRLARQPVALARESDKETSGIVGELVGREGEFTLIIDAWESARRGRAQHLHIVAPAGLGKTRLLNDVRARLKASRSRVCLVRANPGQRDLPYAMIGDVVGCLAMLPGARAVSPGSAAALVAMNPMVSSSYDAVADPAHGDEARRRRGIATKELLEAVADETPLAVLIDDIHWSDEPSRDVLRTVLGALEHQRLLIVTTARPVSDGELSVRGTRNVALSPLTLDDVSALLSSVAAMPDAVWASRFCEQLTASTGGSPLLVLETLQLLIERGLLAHEREKWQTENPVALLAATEGGSALLGRVDSLERGDRWLVLLLAVSGTPLTPELLREASRQSDAPLRARLGRLEERGLLMRLGSEWTLSHDELAAAAIELAGDTDLLAAHGALGLALWTNSGEDLRMLRRAARALHRAGDSVTLAALFSRFARIERARGDRTTNAALARELLGTDTPTDLVRRMVRSLSPAIAWECIRRAV